MAVAIDTDKEGRCVSSHLPLLIYCPLQIHNFKLIFCMFVELAVITRIILSPTSRNLAEYSGIQSWLKFNKTNKKGAQCLCSVMRVLATLDWTEILYTFLFVSLSFSQFWIRLYMANFHGFGLKTIGVMIPNLLKRWQTWEKWVLNCGVEVGSR